MEYEEYQEQKLKNLKEHLRLRNIGPSDLAAKLGKTKSNTSNILNGSKNFSEKFLYQSALAIRLHPDAVNCTSLACRKAIVDIHPAEIPPFKKPAYRTRIKKS